MDSLNGPRLAIPNNGGVKTQALQDVMSDDWKSSAQIIPKT